MLVSVGEDGLRLLPYLLVPVGWAAAVFISSIPRWNCPPVFRDTIRTTSCRWVALLIAAIFVFLLVAIARKAALFGYEPNELGGPMIRNLVATTLLVVPLIVAWFFTLFVLAARALRNAKTAETEKDAR